MNFNQIRAQNSSKEPRADTWIPFGETDKEWKTAKAVAQEIGEKTKVLFIDEISMTQPILFVLLDVILRQAFSEKKHLPFGGLSVVLFARDFLWIHVLSVAKCVVEIFLRKDLLLGCLRHTF